MKNTYSVTDPGIVECEWFVDNGQISSFPENNSVEIIWGENGNGYLSVLATNDMGCVGDTTGITTNIWPVNVDISGHEKIVSIFPNPAKSVITVQISRFDQYSIKITNLNGQLVYSMEMEGTSSQIDLSSFKKGVYLITIRSKDFVTTEKIIKL